MANQIERSRQLERQNSMKINHIGYLVKNFPEAKAEFESLGYKASKNTHDTLQLVDICLMERDGYVIELVSPYDEKSVVAGMMRKHKNAPYHICYEAEDFDHDVAGLIEQGYMKVHGPLPAPAFGSRRVIFLVNHYIGMIELLDIG